MTDFLMEQAYELTLPSSPEGEPVWVTREKRRIPVREMGDNHLLHTITMLRGKSPIGTRFICEDVVRRRWLNILANEAYDRGLAIDALDGKDPVHE
jgi:hypothetical protein